MRVTGQQGHFDPAELRRLLPAKIKFTPDGEPLVSLSQDTPEYYATCTYAETIPDLEADLRDLYLRRRADTDNNILPVDSGSLFTKLQNELGMRVFMPEIGSQISLTRLAVALARGMANAYGKKWMNESAYAEYPMKKCLAAKTVDLEEFNRRMLDDYT